MKTGSKNKVTGLAQNQGAALAEKGINKLIEELNKLIRPPAKQRREDDLGTLRDSVF